jgi:rhodanese-related sulfurtransferase
MILMKTVLTMAPFYAYTAGRGKEKTMARGHGSLVLQYPPASAASSAAHFREALSRSTDPSDVHADLESGSVPFLVLDARSPEAYARAHVPGAINLPHRRIDAGTTSRFSKTVPIVTYCDGIQCNASTKAALKLSELGFPVKEMIGGLDGWLRDGFPVETSAAGEAAGNAAGEAARNAAGEAAERVSCGC